MSCVAALVPSRVWVQAYLLQPFFEGAERLRRAIQGTLPYLFHPQVFPISAQDRVVYALVGTFLLLPLINNVAWVFIRTFGLAEQQYLG